MRFLFVMDPAERMLPDKDTTFAFIRGATTRGHQSLFCAPQDLIATVDPQKGASVLAKARPVEVSDESPHVTVLGEEAVDLAQVDAVLIRKDPPFDTEYLHLTQMLDLVRDQTLVFNDPAGLRAANEKLFALHFHRWMPKTRVQRSPEGILDFVDEVGGRAILKPLDGAGGSGVVALRKDDKNARALVDLLTREGRDQVMVQQFEPRVSEGDKRVLVLDEHILGAILRVPRDDDFRANIHVGGRVRATELTEDERALVEDVMPELRRLGLWFVGLDLIAGRLIEVNVTSPTGIQELGRLSGTRPEERVIEWIEARVGS